MLSTPSLIEKKRDGGILTKKEIATLIADFTSGAMPEYQMSALCMTIYFQGMSAEETADLTQAMLESGSSFQWEEGSPPKVDKHSTGGIGDKVSLVLAPLLACDDLWIPMISGRGLGITGGTLDKLEAIPGFNVNLTEEQAMRQMKEVGAVIMGQTKDVCPADKKIYALRDVTGTVSSRPLIVSSIMSKKLAENLDRLVLDVKYGSGAFMKTREEAEKLSEGLSSVGNLMGVKTTARLTPMNEPLGQTIGNALEVREAVESLQGNGPEDLVNLSLDLAASVSDVSREKLATFLKDGTAWEKFAQMVSAQQGDVSSLEKLTEIHAAPVIIDVLAETTGKLEKIDAGLLGELALQLGAGRQKAGDPIDFAVGFDQVAKIGATLEKNQPLLRIHAQDKPQAEQVAKMILDKGVEIF